MEIVTLPRHFLQRCHSTTTCSRICNTDTTLIAKNVALQTFLQRFAHRKKNLRTGHRSNQQHIYARIFLSACQFPLNSFVACQLSLQVLFISCHSARRSFSFAHIVNFKKEYLFLGQINLEKTLEAHPRINICG
jgi:hypothetical protein